MNWTRRRTLISGLALIAVVNGFVLVGASYNRSGDPESTLRLSERELHIPYVWRDSKDNSGLALELRWRVLPSEAEVKRNMWSYYLTATAPAWLDQAKMTALGFDATRSSKVGADQSSFSHQLPRAAYLVLEQDGAAYRLSLNRFRTSAQADKEGQRRFVEERDTNSRLFVIDAGLDVAALRTQYPDRRRYALVRGQVRPTWDINDGQGKLTGLVAAVSAAHLNVPLEMRPVFDRADRQDAAVETTSVVRYEVEVAFGRRLEPWILRATVRSSD